MSNALDKIISYKTDEVAALKRDRSISDFLREAETQAPPRGFINRLLEISACDDNALICEMKRKSPSAGEILPGANPVDIAIDYEQGGAACLSVLTDYPSFGGTLDDFRAIRNAVGLPMLRKDFMIDPIQVAEARAHGADAILVILACTDDTLAQDLIATAHDLKMDVLLETHNRIELDRALALPARLIGINNRDLTKMTTDLETTERLAGHVKDNRLLVSESGISTAADISRLRRTGARCFLIGESLMKQADRKNACATLRAAK